MYLIKIEKKLSYIDKNYINLYTRIKTPLFCINLKTKSFKKVTLTYENGATSTTDWMDSKGYGQNKRMRDFLTIVNRNKNTNLMLSNYK